MPKTENSQWYVEQVGNGEVHGHALAETLAAGRTDFQSYAVVVSPLFGKMLVLDGDTQSAALDEHIYHEALVHPACVACGGQPARALVLGGGEGATLRELLRVPTIRLATMVDIDREIVDICRRHLPEWNAGAFESPRAEVIIGDAREHVFASGEQFDVIIGDLTEPLEDSPSAQLHTPEMYAAIRKRLTATGVYALQASMSGPHNFRLHAHMIAGLRAAFESVLPYSVYIPAFDTEWGFALCSSARPELFADAAGTPALFEAIDRHVARCGGLRFYDAESHRRLFNVPRYLRDAYKEAAG